MSSLHSFRRNPLQLCLLLFGTLLVNVNANIIGNLDHADTYQVRGWSCDTSNYGASLTVQILIDGNLYVGSVRAEAAGATNIGAYCGGNTNRYFTYAFDNTARNLLTDGRQHTIRVQGIPTQPSTSRTADLTNSPVYISATPQGRNGFPAGPIGYLDTVDTTSATGWTCDPSLPNTAIQVQFYVDGNVFAGSTTANLQRESAVGQQCGGNPYHGFNFCFPPNIQSLLNNGNVHQVRAVAVPIQGGAVELTGSPISVYNTRGGFNHKT